MNSFDDLDTDTATFLERWGVVLASVLVTGGALAAGSQFLSAAWLPILRAMRCA